MLDVRVTNRTKARSRTVTSRAHSSSTSAVSCTMEGRSIVRTSDDAYVIMTEILDLLLEGGANGSYNNYLFI